MTEKRVLYFFDRLMRATMAGDEAATEMALACPDFTSDMLYSAIVMAVGLDEPTDSRVEVVRQLLPVYKAQERGAWNKLNALCQPPYPVRSNAMFTLLRSME